MTRAAEIEAEASAWLARRDSEQWSLADQAALDAWLEHSTAHRVAFLRLEAALSRVDRLRALPSDSPATIEKPWFVRAPVWLAAAAAAVVLSIGVTTWRAEPRNLYETEIGGREMIPLADGSRIELNTDSRVRVAYNAEERQVVLDRGEAYFEVEHDEDHPFVVVVGDQRIVDLGTKFSVRRIGDEVSVIVTEGRVRIEQAGRASQTLAAVDVVEGGVARVAHDEALVTQASAETLDAALSWRDGYLVFRDATLGEAAADFNRYNRTQLVIADPELAAVPIGGRFRSDNLEGFVRLIEQGFGVRADRREAEIVLTAQ